MFVHNLRKRQGWVGKVSSYLPKKKISKNILLYIKSIDAFNRICRKVNNNLALIKHYRKNQDTLPSVSCILRIENSYEKKY